MMLPSSDSGNRQRRSLVRSSTNEERKLQDVNGSSSSLDTASTTSTAASHCHLNQCHNHTEQSREYYVSRLVETFQHALASLSGEIISRQVLEKVEVMSNFVYESMSNPARDYHHVHHIFDLIEGNVCRAEGDDDEQPVLDEIAVLAAIFHDCVYSQVDGGLSPAQFEKLHGAVVPRMDGGFTVSASALHTGEDPLLQIVFAIFGFHEDFVLSPIHCQNELLSAVIAVRELESLLSMEQLVEIAVAIEATIPFRATVDGKSALELLFHRLCGTVSDFTLNLNEDDCVLAVQRAALLANEDVGNFASKDHAWFLDHTWSVLAESNGALREEDLYSLTHFVLALYKLRGFFGYLQSGMIFQEFRGVPSMTECLTRHAARNLHIGSKYISAKLLTVSVMAAFAELTGGADVPMSLLMGDVETRKRLTSALVMKSAPLAQSIDSCCKSSDINCSHGNVCCPDVYDLLVNGRTRETSFDVRQSPIAAYFYSHIGDDGLERLVNDIPPQPMTREVATEFLAALPRAAVKVAGESLAKLAVSRKDKIMGVLQSLPAGNQLED